MRGEGRIFQRGRFWWFAFSQNGEKRGSTKIAVGSRDDAEDWKRQENKALQVLRKEIGKAENGNYIGPGEARISFEDMVADLLNYYSINNLASLASARFYLAHLRAAFGTDRARAITTSRVRKYTADRLAEKAKPATVNKELGALRRMFKLAVEANRLSATSVPIIKVLAENNARQGFLEPADFARFRDALPEYLRDAISFLYLTGWRKGEMHSLEWRDVARDLSAIRLRPEASKNRRGRVLPLAGDLLEIMRRASAARRLDCPYVFHRDGQPIGDIRKAWKKALIVAGLSNLTPHDLRRSGVRNAIRAGVREGVVMAMSGHRTRSMLDRYNISSEDDLAAAAKQITEYVQNNQRAKVEPISKAS